MSRVSTRIFLPGAVVAPVRGTVRWVDGRAVGTWGDPGNPLRLHIVEADGRVRPATRAERRLARRIWPGADPEGES